MTQLLDVIDAALADAAKAEQLVADGRARRALREDPERMLGAFGLHALATVDAAGQRKVRSERRSVEVRRLGTVIAH